MQTLLIAGILTASIFAQPADLKPASLTQPAATAAPAPMTAGPFHVLKTIEVGGEGGWDYVTVDPDSHRLFIPRSTHVVVVDTETGKSVGDISSTSGVHGVAIASVLGKGFSSNGKSDDVTVFDLKTLKVEKTVKVGKNPDSIIFEPTTKRVFVFNGRSKDATVISATDLSIVATIPLGGKPEFSAVDEQGKLFVNIEDTSELLRIDALSLKIEQRTPLSPAEEPSGLAIDAAHHKLFAVCANEKMAVVDGQTGKVLATPAIGKRVDGAAFDTVGGFALSANGEGTISVIGTTGDKPFTLVQTLPTAKGARTIVIDPKTRRAYLPTADFEAPAAGDTSGKRPKMKPGTFKIVVVGVS